MGLELGRDNVLYLHVTLIPFIKASEELKTKPTQHSVGKLREIGINPDIIVCRSEKPLSSELKTKLGLFCSVPAESVIEAPDVDSIYEVPVVFHKQGLDDQILMLLRLRTHSKDFEELNELSRKVKAASKKELPVTLAGKYADYKDAYKSVNEALIHAGIFHGVKVRIEFIETSSAEAPNILKGSSAILVPGGFGDRGIEGKILAAKIARERKIPYFGLCLGLQIGVIEYARDVLGLQDANSTEFNPKTKYPVIDLLPDQKEVSNMGATMRLGSYECTLKKGTLAHKAYGKTLISERHRHRYEFNNKFRKDLEEAGLIISGTYAAKDLVEIIELKDHPWFLAVQFHPEFKSRPENPHPLFRDFIGAALKKYREDNSSPSLSLTYD